MEVRVVLIAHLNSNNEDVPTENDAREFVHGALRLEVDERGGYAGVHLEHFTIVSADEVAEHGQ